MVAAVGENGAEASEKLRILRLAQERDTDQIEGEFEPVRPGRDRTGEVGGLAVVLVEEDDEIEQRLRILPFP